MVITLIEAKLTRDTEWLGKMDPYVIFKYREQEWKSTVCQDQGKTPKWVNQHWEIDVKYLGDDLRFTVYDEDVTKDDVVGEGITKMSALSLNGGLDEWYTIQYEGKSAGKLHFTSKWTPAH